MSQIDDKLYWFTRLGLRREAVGNVFPIERSRGDVVVIVSIPRNDHDIKIGWYIAKVGRVGGLVPVEGPYRTRAIAAMAVMS